MSESSTRRTKIVSPYVMAGCMRRATHLFRRHNMRTELHPEPGNMDQSLFNHVEWMVRGNHALEIPQLCCLAKRHPEVLAEVLQDFYGLEKKVSCPDDGFSVAALARFRFAAGSPLSAGGRICVHRLDDRHEVLRCNRLSHPVLRIRSKKLALHVTQYEGNKGPFHLPFLLQVDDELEPDFGINAVVLPHMHVSHWDEMSEYYGLRLGSGDQARTLRFAWQHTLLEVDAESPADGVAQQVRDDVIELQPPLLLWIKRDGPHFELPVLIGLLEKEDVADS